MNKKIVKIISVISIILCMVMSFSMVFAEDVNISSITNSHGDQNTNMQIAANAWSILTIIRNVGVVIAVIIILVIGIKYIMGSVEEKAEYKKTMMPYLIGAVLLLGATGIATLVINLAGNINSGGQA